MVCQRLHCRILEVAGWGRCRHRDKLNVEIEKSKRRFNLRPSARSTPAIYLHIFAHLNWTLRKFADRKINNFTRQFQKVKKYRRACSEANCFHRMRMYGFVRRIVAPIGFVESSVIRTWFFFTHCVARGPNWRLSNAIKWNSSSQMVNICPHLCMLSAFIRSVWPSNKTNKSEWVWSVGWCAICCQAHQIRTPTTAWCVGPPHCPHPQPTYHAYIGLAFCARSPAKSRRYNHK